MEEQEEFKKFFGKVIDDVLKQIFGQAAALIIYNYLEKNDSLSQQEIPEKIESFVKGLESFLDSGALVVEGVILKTLYSSYGISFKQVEEGHSFAEYVNQLKDMVGKSRVIKRES